jgi:transcriptional regulator with XRE-family HTH domain
MSEQQNNTLNTANLGVLLKERRGSLSLRQAAAEAGISFSTFARVEGGSQPDLVTFTKLCSWLGVNPSDFFTPRPIRKMSNVEQIVAQLRNDPLLSEGAGEHISNLLRDLYSVMAKPQGEPDEVTVQMQSHSMFRPGVSKKLGALLADLEIAVQARANEI